MDRKLNNSISNSVTIYFLGIYDVLGKLMIVADSDAQECEYKAYDSSMRMLIDYVENHFPGGGKVEVPTCLRFEMDWDTAGYDDG